MMTLMTGPQGFTRYREQMGVAITCWDPAWMPRALFERAGFVEVGPAGSGGAVLFKPFADMEPPRWVGHRPEMELVRGRVVVDVYHTDRWPIPCARL